MTVSLSLDSAPAFIAQLVREGVRFHAEEKGNEIIINFDGGF
jgi:hypothetical protein